MYRYDLEIEKYREGIMELLFYNPPLGSIARSMGQPMFDEDQETAYVTFDAVHRVRFCFNPDFIMSMEPRMIAAVIAHEALHLALYHLEEMQDKETFPHVNDLTVAQECVINDTIENVHGMQMPDFVYRGMDVIQEDCSQYSSKQVYDKLPHNEDELHGACGGMHIDDENLGEYHKEINDIIEKAAKDEGLSHDDFMKQISNSMGGGYQTASKLSYERMNWKYLLAKINPKVMDSGSKKRTKNNWLLKNNRRLISSYPKVILPSIDNDNSKADAKGNSIPSLVIALDLSGSIPRQLVKTLQGLLDDIPDNLIRAFPCTWSDALVPYDPDEGRTCGSMGTNISLVEGYVKKIQSTEGIEPYVLVITDGQFYPQGDNKPGRDWYYMAINRSSIRQCRRHTTDDDHVYLVDDFKA